MLRSRIIVKGDLEQAVGAEQHAKGDKDEQHGDAEPAGKTAGGDTDEQDRRADQKPYGQEGSPFWANGGSRR